MYSKFSSDAQAIYRGLILCHIIGSAEMRPNNVKESMSLRRDHHYTSPDTVEGEGSIEVHAQMFLGGGGLPSLSPFTHKVRQGLGFDCRLGYVCHVEAHKLKCPLGNPSRGESIPDNFSEPKCGHHPDWAALEIMQELELCNQNGVE
jgi:hypothetical protein